MKGLWLPLAEVGLVLLASGAIGYTLTGALGLAGRGRSERAAWGFAAGLTLLAAPVAVASVLHAPPVATISVTAILAIVAALLTGRKAAALSLTREDRGSSEPTSPVGLLLLLIAACGVAFYFVRALAEPMWSNDFLAIWGLKGKMIFATHGVPGRLFTDPSLGLSHPEYPLGLPFLFASLAFLLGRWDDHAMAVLYPFLQIATLLALAGWARRRGASKTVALGAAALLAHFEPLYSGFSAGLADVPFSFAALLLGTALVDSLDRTDPFAPRRLALASFLAVSTKNEGLLLVAAAAVLALFASRRSSAASRPALAALLAPAAILAGIGRLWKGSLPLRDFDFAYLTTRLSELPPRAGESIRTAFVEVVFPAWPGLVCLGILIAARRSTPSGNRLLVLAGMCALGYLLVPSLAVLGPDWLVRTSLSRTVSALAPLTAAAVAGLETNGSRST